jgi:hypothetical protein
MAGSSRLVAPTLERLRTVLKQLEGGELLVPRFQRGFVWKDDQRLQLLDSVRKGMPIGSILVWRSKSRRLLTSGRIGPFPVHEPDEYGPYVYVLDGLQRLATLYGALWPRTREPLSEEGTRWPILYDLENENFRLSSSSRRADPPVTQIEPWRLFDGRGFYEHEKRLIEAGKETERKRAEELRDAFEDYVIPIFPIQSEDLEQVTETFRRVNSQGTKMSELHMVNAIAQGPEMDVGYRLGALREELAALGWGDVDRQVLLNTAKIAVGLDYYRSDPQQIRKNLEAAPASFDEILPALQRAIRFLTEECGVAGPRMLPYDPQLVLLAEAARKRGADLTGTGEVVRRLRRWFWQTTYTEYFTGASNAKIRRAVNHVVQIATNGGEAEPEDLDRRVDPIDAPRANTVRTTAFLLFLATLKPCSIDGELPAAHLLAQGGLDAAPKIIREREAPPGVDTRGIENRWLVPPSQSDAVREAIKLGQASIQVPWNRLLDGHAFTEEAAAALARGDLGAALRLRKDELRLREERFLKDLGLEYAPAVGSPTEGSG